MQTAPSAFLTCATIFHTVHILTANFSELFAEVKIINIKTQNFHFFSSYDNKSNQMKLKLHDVLDVTNYNPRDTLHSRKQYICYFQSVFFS